MKMSIHQSALPATSPVVPPDEELEEELELLELEELELDELELEELELLELDELELELLEELELDELELGRPVELDDDELELELDEELELEDELLEEPPPPQALSMATEPASIKPPASLGLKPRKRLLFNMIFSAKSVFVI